MEATEDPGTTIVARGPGWIRYQDLASGETWLIVGECNRCGLCDVGAVGRRLVWSHPPGMPGAVLDLDYGRRRDMPMRPPLPQGCSLREG